MDLKDEDVDVVVKPLDSLEQVMGWEAPDNGHLNTAIIPLSKRNVHSINQPRTLVCHDMKGGYLDDRFVQGGLDATSYRFFHWSHVDIYVYFSHSFITIPPPGWIDAAHLHGVPVLGTLITESEGGTDICRTLFNGRDPYFIRNFIEKLVDIAKFYRFEGWLINIENPIEAEHVRHLRNFLYWLTIKMRTAIPDSYVIWYDSVTLDGELKWQNELNNKNKTFFDACDGIYLNYNWDDEKLSNSLQLSSQRVADVYVGIDVFGRGTLGGGGFNSDVAFKAIRNAGLSVALFAPGWVHEVLGTESFTENEYKFWSFLTDFSPIHGPAQLPFFSSFCQGFGDSVYRRGKVISGNKWCNLSLQQYQPTDHSFYNRENAPHKVCICTSDAYSGGGCLQVSGDQQKQPIPLFRLLKTEFELKVSLLCTYTFKVVDPVDELQVALLLTVGDKSEQVKSELLLSSEQPQLPSVLATRQPAVTLLSPVHKSLIPDLLQQGIRIPRKPDNGWITRCYIISPDYGEAFIKQMSLVLSLATDSRSDYQLMLGQIQLLPMHSLLERHQLDVSCAHLAISRVSNDQSMELNCIVRWTGQHSHLLNHYDLYCRLLWKDETEQDQSVTRYVGTSRRSAYKVNQFPLPCPSNPNFTLRFMVQEHCAGLIVPDVDRAPFVEVQFQ